MNVYAYIFINHEDMCRDIYRYRYINIHIFISKHILLSALCVPDTVLGLKIQQKRWILNNSNCVVTLLRSRVMASFHKGA